MAVPGLSQRDFLYQHPDGFTYPPHLGVCQDTGSNTVGQVLQGGLAGGSTGVMMFTTYAVAEDEGKTEVMKKVYTHSSNEPDR